jgi:hypothetical protein
MGEYNNNIKKIEFNKTNFYKNNNQWIIGITVNKEVETYNCNTDDYGNITGGENYNKHEFNLWLGLVGLHMTIRKKLEVTSN